MPKVSQQHLDERRQQILAGARAVFAREGYEGATVARLEREIRLSRGAIFNYFASKWELFLALAQEDQSRGGEIWVTEGYEAVLRHIVAESPDWLGIYLEIGRLLRGDAELRERWAERNPELSSALVHRAEELQARGELRSDLTAEQIVQFQAHFLDGVALALSYGYPVDVEPALELLRAALRPQ